MVLRRSLGLLLMFLGGITLSFSAFVRDAHAVLVWGERDKKGTIELSWARGASPEEAINLLRAHSGETVNILLTCRDAGWFAFVGSAQDSRRGFSCGYNTKGAALFKARKECDIEGGRCDIERIGYDDGSTVLPSGEARTQATIPGAPNDRSPVHTIMGPIRLQKWGILDY